YPKSWIFDELPNLEDKICIYEIVEPTGDWNQWKPSSGTVAKLLNDFSEERGSTKRLRWIRRVALVLLALLIAAVGLFIYSWRQRNVAISSRNEAVRQEKLATDREREVRRTLAAADFNRANNLLELGAGADAVAYLARSIRTDGTNHDAANLLCSVLLTRNFPLLVTDSLRHEGEIVSVSFSPDGQSILTADGRTAHIWSTSSGAPVGEPLRHDFNVNGAEFSPDGKSVLTFGNRATLWDVRT